MPGLSELVFISAGSPAYLAQSTGNAAAPAPTFPMKSLFSNNAQVFYKPGSLSVSSGGSVTNARRKASRT